MSVFDGKNRRTSANFRFDLMPFLAECILCRQKLRMPDHVAGASVQCPRCGSYFTAAPEDHLNPKRSAVTANPPAAAAPIAAAPRSVAGPPEAMPARAAPSTTTEPAAAIPVADAPPAEAPAAAETQIKLPVFPVGRPAPPARGFDLIGAAAITLAGLAGWCALVFILMILVIPLAILGLITALVGLAVGLLHEPPRYLLASAGGVASILILLAALFAPSLLGPTYLLAREKPEPEVVVPRVVPLPGRTLAKGETAPEWPDATRYSVMVKAARIQVVGAEVRPLEIATTPKRKFTKESYLVLRLRIHQPAGGAEFASDGWGEGGTAQERRQPTLTDDTGKSYNPAPANVAGEAGALTKRSTDFPLGITDDVYLFEAPAPTATSLRLEFPATSWGGTGMIRFTIPRSMLQMAAPKMTDKGN